jgi:drug/metabolite transporter superfamily protein YnfA
MLFVLAAIAEIGGAWLIWQGLRETAAGSGSAPA